MQRAWTLLLLTACTAPPGGDAECTLPGDCAQRVESACGSACPTEIERACIASRCEDLAVETQQVRADVMLRSSLTGQVQSMVFAFVDPRSAADDTTRTCADLWPGALAVTDPSLNVAHSGFVNFAATAGTAYFPDANLGSVHHGSYLLHVTGHAQARGEGTRVASACLDLVQVDASLAGNLTLTLTPAP
ncbi:MAG: hypothetical protein ABIJ09_13010 [Pseudomonadota bacterium]